MIQHHEWRLQLVERYPGRHFFDGFFLRAIEVPEWHPQGWRHYPDEDHYVREELAELRKPWRCALCRARLQRNISAEEEWGVAFEERPAATIPCWDCPNREYWSSFEGQCEKYRMAVASMRFPAVLQIDSR